MQNTILLFMGLLFNSCNSHYDYLLNEKITLIKKETISIDFHIKYINTMKYSKVRGYVFYKGFKIYINNGNSGYYYKKYNLKENDIIKVNLNIYYYDHSYSNGYETFFGDVDLSKYEISK
jgi:hypothetical protein